MIMDRREKLIHLVMEALEKARELQAFALDGESKAKAAGLMERVRKSHKTIEALNEVSAANGKGLDKATLDSALDRLIETMDGVNRELDTLLAKAKGE
jgi:propanediol dehydratase small subunit